MEKQQLSSIVTIKITDSKSDSSFLQLTIISCLLICLVLFFGCKASTKKEKSLPKNSVIVPNLEVLKSKLDLHANEGLFYYEGLPFSGYSVRYYPTDTLAEKIGFYQGKKEGNYQKWFPNGVLSYSANLIKGRNNGLSKTWWKNGVLRSESNQIMGVSQGNQKQWYQSGQLFKSINIVDDREEGIQKAWRKNGKLYNNYEAKNGRIFGLKRASLCFELEEEVVQVKSDN